MYNVYVKQTCVCVCVCIYIYIYYFYMYFELGPRSMSSWSATAQCNPRSLTLKPRSHTRKRESHKWNGTRKIWMLAMELLLCISTPAHASRPLLAALSSPWLVPASRRDSIRDLMDLFGRTSFST